MNNLDYQIIKSLHVNKNITKTALQLAMTQPAISIRVKNIEQELGVTLIIRSKRGVCFTPEGEEIAKWAEQILAGMNKIKNFISESKGIICGSLSIGVPVHYARHCLPVYIEQYTKKYPNVTIEVHTGHSRQMYRLLLNHIIDLTIVRGEFIWNESKIFISSEPICLACTDLNVRHNLQSSRYIYRKTDDIMDNYISIWLTENHLNCSPKLIIDEADVCKQLLLSNSWMIAPRLSLTGFSGYVEPLYMQDGTPLVRNTYVLCRHFYEQLPQVKLFIEELKKDYSLNYS